MEQRTGRAGRSKEQPVRATGKWGRHRRGMGAAKRRAGSTTPSVLAVGWGCAGTVPAEHWGSAASPHHWGHLVFPSGVL